MKRVGLFLLLAGLGWFVLVQVAGGMAGPRRADVTTEVKLEPIPQDVTRGPATPVHVDALPLGAARPRDPPKVELSPMGAFVTSINKPFQWIDPVTAEVLHLPHYTTLSLRMDAPTAEASPTQGVPWFKWRRVNLVTYREPASLSRAEVDAVLADPTTRRNLVLYEVEADEGSANINPQSVAEGERPLPPRFVLRLTKDVRVTVVPDDVRLRANGIVIDHAAETLDGTGDVLASGPGFTASGTGLRIDKRTGRVEILRNVTYRAEHLSLDRAAPTGPTAFSGMDHPRLIRSRGPFLLVRHNLADGRSAYESVLTEDVEVETVDGGRLTAQRVVIDAVPEDEPRNEPTIRSDSGRNDPQLAAGARRFRLRSFVAETAVRIRHEDRPPDGAEVRTVTIETDRLTGRADDPTRAGVVLEGRTVLTYHGTLPVPDSAARVGTVVARCRDRLTYGSAAIGNDARRVGDVVVELVGAVEIEGAARPGEGSQRLTADRVRLTLRPAPKPVAVAPVATPAGTALPRPGTEFVAVAFHASGEEVRLSGPLVSARADDIRADGLDTTDGWRLTLAGPNAHVEVDERAAPTSSADGRATTQGPASPPRPGKPEPAPSAWVADVLEATGGVRGALAPRPDDTPVRFEAASLHYSEAKGGELRGGTRGHARLLYLAGPGREQTLEAPRVGFALDDVASRLWTRGGTTAVLFTNPTSDHGTPRPGRRSFVLRGGSGIEAFAGRSGAAEPTVTVRVRETASIETLYDGVGADRLEAGALSVVLVDRVGARPFASPFGRSTGTPTSRAVATPRAKPSTVQAPESTRPTSRRDPLGAGPARWTLTCAEIDVALTGRGEGLAALHAFTATGDVVATTDPQADGSRQRFEGERLELRADGARHRGRLLARAEQRARIEASEATLPQWIASPAIDFVLDSTTLVEAQFAAPVSARFHHLLSGGGLFDDLSGRPGAPTPTGPATEATAPVERLALRVDGGPLSLVRRADGHSVVTALGNAASPVVLARSVRAPNAAEFDDAVKLASPHVTLTLRDLFGTATTPDRFEARGPGTRVEVPSDEGTILATGHDLVYDRVTSLLRLDGPTGVLVTSPRLRLRGLWFTYNLKTGARDVGAPQLEAAR